MQRSAIFHLYQRPKDGATDSAAHAVRTVVISDFFPIDIVSAVTAGSLRSVVVKLNRVQG